MAMATGERRNVDEVDVPLAFDMTTSAFLIVGTGVSVATEP